MFFETTHSNMVNVIAYSGKSLGGDSSSNICLSPLIQFIFSF